MQTLIPKRVYVYIKVIKFIKAGEELLSNYDWDNDKVCPFHRYNSDRHYISTGHGADGFPFDTDLIVNSDNGSQDSEFQPDNVPSPLY